MGNYKFRLSDMMPNAWFYKLKDTSRANRNNHPTKKKHYQQPISSSTSSSPSSLSSTLAPALTTKSKPREAHITSQHRKSYYITRDLIPSTSPSPPPPPIHQTYTIATTSYKANSEASPPRKSSKKRRSNKRMNKQLSPKPDRLVKSTVSASCSCRATLESVWIANPEPDSTAEDLPNSPLDSSSEHDSLLPEFGSASDRGLTPTPGLETFDGRVSWSTSCRCRVQNDDVIDLADNKLPIHAKFNNELDLVSEIELPPILTKPTKVTSIDKAADNMKNNCSIGGNEQTRKCQRNSTKFEERKAQVSLSLKVVKEENIMSTKEQRTSPIRRFSVHSPGLKLKTNSPRLASRRMQARKSVSSSSSSSSRRSLSESCAVVKSSSDPQRDFRESMVEMIVENNIRASKDLEELLACYLSLNADEYHDLIIEAFKQIWFDIADIQMK